MFAGLGAIEFIVEHAVNEVVINMDFCVQATLGLR